MKGVLWEVVPLGAPKPCMEAQSFQGKFPGRVSPRHREPASVLIEGVTSAYPHGLTSPNAAN